MALLFLLLFFPRIIAEQADSIQLSEFSILCAVASQITGKKFAALAARGLFQRQPCLRF